jgi:ATP-dependent RNA helicase DDX27
MEPEIFIMTIDSDEEDNETNSVTNRRGDVENIQLDPEFVFDPSGDAYTDIIASQTNLEDFIKKGSRPVCSSSL